MKLTDHFTVDELLRNSGAQRLPDHIVINATRTAEMLEAVRSQLGDQRIIIGSWYRTPEKNSAVGGAPNSAHLSGYGVDFNVPGLTSAEVVTLLRAHASRLAFDQLIDERDHVHISADPRARRQVLVEPVEGTFASLTTPLPAVKVTAQAPSPESTAGKNAKIVAIIGAIASILEIARRLLTE